MGQVRDLIGAQRAAAAGVLGPAEHSGLEEGAIDDQLTPDLEQVEQAHFALGPLELVLLLHGHPRHAPAFGGQRVTSPGQGLLFHEKLLTCSVPLLRRHDRGCVLWKIPFQLLHVSLLVCCHLISPLFSENRPRRFTLKNFLNLPMHKPRIPPVDPAPATITLAGSAADEATLSAPTSTTIAPVCKDHQSREPQATTSSL